MISKKTTHLISLILIIEVIGCGNIDSNPFVSKEVKQGHKLAEQYCKSCHQFPEADLLNKKTWAKYVLPKMGGLLGFRHFDVGDYINEGSAMKLDEWNNIVRYYISQAPEDPLKVKRNNIGRELKNFQVVIPSSTIKQPVTTAIAIDPLNQKIYFGDGLTKNIYALAKDLHPIDSFPINDGVCGIRFKGSEMMAISMGVLYPSDEKKGKLQVMMQSGGGSYTLLDSLQRPVHASYADFNQDGREDIVISEFGNKTGALSWFENIDGQKYAKRILRALPGAVRSEVYDFNNDGRPDIIALMAQGDEGMFIYYNEPTGKFREQQILQFPPSYGSNYFELADFNNDGHPDIIATNGDNGDYPPIFKAYHGIRIYLNDGKNQFKQALFLPVNGAGKAVARDFDGDGDLDIASIAYFPDYDHSPEEAFIYWENNGGLSFEPCSFKEVSSGRWLTMDAGDIDGDGDLDIILGNASFPFGYVPESLKKEWKRFPVSVVVLRNRLH